MCGRATSQSEEIDGTRPSLDPLAIQNVHIQALCRADAHGRGEERVGIGILEQLVLGVHEPSGFAGLLDGAQ